MVTVAAYSAFPDAHRRSNPAINRIFSIITAKSIHIEAKFELLRRGLLPSLSPAAVKFIYS